MPPYEPGKQIRFIGLVTGHSGAAEGGLRPNYWRVVGSRRMTPRLIGNEQSPSVIDASAGQLRCSGRITPSSEATGEADNSPLTWLVRIRVEVSRALELASSRKGRAKSANRETGCLPEKDGETKREKRESQESEQMFGKMLESDADSSAVQRWFGDCPNPL